MFDYRAHAKPHLDKFKNIKLLILDNDGIMNTGKLIYQNEGVAIGVEYDVLDGYGMINASQAGLKIAVVSGRKNDTLSHRLEVLKLKDNLYMGVSHKGTYVQKLKQEFGLDKSQVAFMGDDYIDLSAFEEVGLSITVPNCHPMVLSKVNYVTKNYGGQGAVREVLDLIRIANPDDSAYTQKLLEYFNSGE